MKLYFFLMLLFPLFLQAQEIKIESQFGFAWGRIDNVKKFMLYNAKSIGYEKLVAHNLFVTIGAGITTVQFDNTDVSFNKYYSKSQSLFVPVTIRRYESVSRKSFVYVELGISNNYSYKTKMEYAAKDSTIDNNGYYSGIIVKAGFKTKLYEKWYFDMGIGLQNDIYMANNNAMAPKLQRKYILTTLYRKLGK